MKEVRRNPFPRRDRRPRAVTVIQEGGRLTILGSIGVKSITVTPDSEALLGVGRVIVQEAGND